METACFERVSKRCRFCSFGHFPDCKGGVPISGAPPAVDGGFIGPADTLPTELGYPAPPPKVEAAKAVSGTKVVEYAWVAEKQLPPPVLDGVKVEETPVEKMTA